MRYLLFKDIIYHLDNTEIFTITYKAHVIKSRDK